jgi:hypothetical protein
LLAGCLAVKGADRLALLEGEINLWLAEGDQEDHLIGEERRERPMFAPTAPP